MFDAHVYAYYRAPYRMVMLSRWPPWQTGKWVNPARICGEERPAYTHFLCRLFTFNFFLFLFYPSNFFTVISICARPPLLFLILNYRTTNIHLNVILFFFLFPKICIASYISNFACWFCSCEDLRIISIYENIRKRDMRYARGETLRFHQLFREKKITREVARYKSSRDRCPLSNHSRGHSVSSNGTKSLTTINFLSLCRVEKKEN